MDDACYVLCAVYFEWEFGVNPNTREVCTLPLAPAELRAPSTTTEKPSRLPPWAVLPDVVVAVVAPS